MGAKRSAARLIDLETVRFTGALGRAPGPGDRWGWLGLGMGGWPKRCFSPEKRDWNWGVQRNSWRSLYYVSICFCLSVLMWVFFGGLLEYDWYVILFTRCNTVKEWYWNIMLPYNLEGWWYEYVPILYSFWNFGSHGLKTWRHDVRPMVGRPQILLSGDSFTTMTKVESVCLRVEFAAFPTGHWPELSFAACATILICVGCTVGKPEPRTTPTLATFLGG